MKLIRILWLRCLLASYQHDLLHAGERIADARNAQRYACAAIERVKHQLRELESQ